MKNIVLVSLAMMMVVGMVEGGCGKGFKQLVAITCKGSFGERKLLSANPSLKSCSKPEKEDLLKVCLSKFPASVKASMNNDYSGCYTSTRSFWREHGVDMSKVEFEDNFPVIRTGFGKPRGSCFVSDDDDKFKHEGDDDNISIKKHSQMHH